MATQTRRDFVLVGRHWNKPDIHVFVTNEEIGIRMELKDFIAAVLKESGNPALLLTANGLKKRVEAAAEKVIEAIKSETARVM